MNWTFKLIKKKLFNILKSYF